MIEPAESWQTPHRVSSRTRLFGTAAQGDPVTLAHMSGAVRVSRPSGRPREFDVGQVLDNAIELFRTHGFEGSSVADLERSTGLSKSSLYSAFGSKQGIFRQALERYKRLRLAGVAEILGHGTLGLDDLHRALDLQQGECLSIWGRQGCLAVNAMVELGSNIEEAEEANADFRESLRSLIRQPLERAFVLGEISGEVVPGAVALMLSLTLGVSVLMRAGADPLEIAAHFDAAHAAVESWRLKE